MKKNYHVLLVDDHPIITTAYKKTFETIAKEDHQKVWHIYEAHRLEDAHNELRKFHDERPLDVVLVDLKLPPVPQLQLLSGEDFALKVKKDFPEVKVIIATTYNNNFRIQNLFKSLDPDGFLVKNDLDEKELYQCIVEVMDGIPYYSKTVRSVLRKYVVHDRFLDQLDRRILYELSLGNKTKDLPQLLPLSSSGIERRKGQLKRVFGVEDKNDKALLQKARELGFI
ncbi:response regulator [Mesonia sp. K7]|uniref:response regulator n=1 Tax=Mesonia sp. K7 TaxID=2218606 RepID=UPI000DA8B5D6|nr:response regulator [Mesonia sp. K7]PZD76441.1 DNA-binding response regulator [Mesonia sp. K7]